LYYEDILISIIGIQKHKNKYNIISICNKNNYNIIDGYMKLFDYFILKHKPDNVKYIMNRSYPNFLFSNFGFKLLSKTEPNCFYHHNNEIFIEKEKILQKNIKHINKIYDSGNLIFEWCNYSVK